MSNRATTHAARWRNERAASDLLGVDVRAVTKSGLAIVAVYLAARAGACPDDLAAAADTLWKEWDLLHEQGIVPQARPVLRGSHERS